MKRKILLIVLILCLVVGMAYAGQKNAASLNPLGIIVNTYMGSYERVITDYLSANVVFAYSPDFLWITDSSFLSVYPGARYYMGPLLGDLFGDSLEGLRNILLSPAPYGLYAGAYLGMSTIFDDEYLSFGGGIDIGYKLGFSKTGISLFAEPYIGVEFLTNDSEMNGFKYGVNFGVLF